MKFKRTSSTKGTTVPKWVDVTTQAELDKVIEAGDYARLKGNGTFKVTKGHAEAYDSATVTAYGSATVTANDSATVTATDSATVTAYGSATVTAYDSATVRAYDSATVTANGSATVRASGSATVTAYDSATVRAYGSATVTATPYVAVTRHGTTPKVTGGVLVQVPEIKDVKTFLEYYGLKPSRAKEPTVVLYKAVGDDFKSGYAVSYAPGEKPEAKDWDGGMDRCGGGLHLGPRPVAAMRYRGDATKFVACTVRVADIALITSYDVPDKCKVPRVIKCQECDIDGNLV